MSARNSSTTRVLAVLAAAGAAGAVLAGCSPDEHPSDAPGTRPSVITGDQVKPGDEVNGGADRSSSEEATVTLATTQGTSVGTATFTTDGSKVSVNVRVSGLEAGAHGIHIHTVGKCDADVDFASAEGHLQVDGHTGKPESGDLGEITVAKNGTGTLESTTEAFTVDQIRGKSLIVHKLGDPDGTQREACGVIAAES